MKIVCFNPPKFIKKFLRLFKSNKQKGEKVDQIALESGFAPKFVEENGEHSPGSSLFSYAFAPQGVPGVIT